MTCLKLLCLLVFSIVQEKSETKLASPADKKGGADLAHCACIFITLVAARWPGMHCTFPYNTIDTHSKPYSYE